MRTTGDAQLLGELEAIWRRSIYGVSSDTLLLSAQVLTLAALAWRRQRQPQGSTKANPSSVTWDQLSVIAGPRFREQLVRLFEAAASPGVVSAFDPAALERLDDERAVGMLLRWALEAAQHTDAAAFLDGLVSTFDTPKGSAVVLDEPVAALLVGLLDIRDGQDVADPFCRTGEVLHAVASRAQSEGVSALRFQGYDVSLTLMQVASLRALLSPFDTQIEQRDALFDPPEAAGRLRQFDRVVTAPPLNHRADLSALERDPYLRFRMGVQSRTGADIARIEHILASLKPEGRAVVLLPVGLLFRGGHEERVRAALLQEGLIDTIITLAPGALYGTRIATAVLVLARARPADRRDRIRYINAADLGDPRRAAPPDVPLVQRILAAAMGDTTEAGFVQWVPLAEIEANQWSLAPARYFPPVHAPAPDPAEVAADFDALVAERHTAEAHFTATAARLAALLERAE